MASLSSAVRSLGYPEGGLDIVRSGEGESVLMRQGPRWGRGAAMLAVGLMLPGCTVPVNTARMEALMIKAGFQIKRADTPERLAHLRTLAPLKLVKHERDGAQYYVYADPEGCQCAYVGNEAAYQQYQKL